MYLIFIAFIKRKGVFFIIETIVLFQSMCFAVISEIHAITFTEIACETIQTWVA